jgi:hypothetical protein
MDLVRAIVVRDDFHEGTEGTACRFLSVGCVMKDAVGKRPWQSIDRFKGQLTTSEERGIRDAKPVNGPTSAG